MEKDFLKYVSCIVSEVHTFLHHAFPHHEDLLDNFDCIRGVADNDASGATNPARNKVAPPIRRHPCTSTPHTL